MFRLLAEGVIILLHGYGCVLKAERSVLACCECNEFLLKSAVRKMPVPDHWFRMFPDSCAGMEGTRHKLTDPGETWFEHHAV